MAKNITSYLLDVELEATGVLNKSEAVELEKQVAIRDLLANSQFDVISETPLPAGGLRLKLSIHDENILFEVNSEPVSSPHIFQVSAVPFRRIVREYFLICESYFEASKKSNLRQIEAIDMGRRAIHNEAGEMLLERLRDKINMDLDTARRIFTLICVLHIRA